MRQNAEVRAPLARHCKENVSSGSGCLYAAETLWCCAAADAADGSVLAQARAQERVLLDATDRWNAVTAHAAQNEHLKSQLWEAEFTVSSSTQLSVESVSAYSLHEG